MQHCPAQRSETRPGLDIELGGRSAVETSDEWRVAGWLLQFVRLAPGEAVPLDHERGKVHLKAITGSLVDPLLTPFASPRTVRTTLVDASEATAGADGALVAVFTATAGVPDNLHAIDQLAFEGPLAEVLEWTTFFERFGPRAEVFRDLDGHIVPGFHLLDADGAEIVYVHFWAMGKGGDASTHNHSGSPSPTAPAFTEIHWVFNNGTGSGGMYECAQPGAPRTSYPMQRGDEHGPFWHIDAQTGLPMNRPNGAIDYPWHGWRGGTDDRPEQAYDFVAAFEINPAHGRVPLL